MGVILGLLLALLPGVACFGTNGIVAPWNLAVSQQEFLIYVIVYVIVVAGLAALYKRLSHFFLAGFLLLIIFGLTFAIGSIAFSAAWGVYFKSLPPGFVNHTSSISPIKQACLQAGGWLAFIPFMLSR